MFKLAVTEWSEVGETKTNSNMLQPALRFFEATVKNFLSATPLPLYNTTSKYLGHITHFECTQQMCLYVRGVYIVCIYGHVCWLYMLHLPTSQTRGHLTRALLHHPVPHSPPHSHHNTDTSRSRRLPRLPPTLLPCTSEETLEVELCKSQDTKNKTKQFDHSWLAIAWKHANLVSKIWKYGSIFGIAGCLHKQFFYLVC